MLTHIFKERSERSLAMTVCTMANVTDVAMISLRPLTLGLALNASFSNTRGIMSNEHEWRSDYTWRPVGWHRCVRCGGELEVFHRETHGVKHGDIIRCVKCQTRGVVKRTQDMCWRIVMDPMNEQPNVSKYQVVDDDGNVYCTFSSREECEQWLARYQSDCLAADGDDDCLMTLKIRTTTQINADIMV